MAQDTQKATRAYIHRVLDKMNIKGTELARNAGVAPSTINRFMNSEDATHTLGLATLAKVAAYSGIAVPASVLKMAEADKTESNVDMSRRVSLPGDGAPVMPVYAAVGGSSGDTLDLGTVTRRIPVPAVLAGVENACGVYISGTSMEERYYAGEILYVHPRKPVRPHDFVVVELAGNEGIVKRFVGWEGDTLIVEQFNPKRRLKIARSQVAALHRVVGSQEG